MPCLTQEERTEGEPFYNHLASLEPDHRRKERREEQRGGRKDGGWRWKACWDAIGEQKTNYV